MFPANPARGGRHDDETTAWVYRMNATAHHSAGAWPWRSPT